LEQCIIRDFVPTSGPWGVLGKLSGARGPIPDADPAELQKLSNLYGGLSAGGILDDAIDRV
jgi:hypothetical protein